MADKNKMRVLITAGASGIGAQIARDFLTAGHKVAICDIDAEALREFQTQNPTEKNLQASVCDATDPAQMTAFFTEALAHLGGLDVVVASAGTGGPAGAIETLTAPDWNACIAANLTSAFLTAKLAAPIMRGQKSGLLVFMSSTAGLFGYPHC